MKALLIFGCLTISFNLFPAKPNQDKSYKLLLLRLSFYNLKYVTDFQDIVTLHETLNIFRIQVAIVNGRCKIPTIHDHLRSQVSTFPCGVFLVPSQIDSDSENGAIAWTLLVHKHFNINVTFYSINLNTNRGSCILERVTLQARYQTRNLCGMKTHWYEIYVARTVILTYNVDRNVLKYIKTIKPPYTVLHWAHQVSEKYVHNSLHYNHSLGVRYTHKDGEFYEPDRNMDARNANTKVLTMLYPQLVQGRNSQSGVKYHILSDYWSYIGFIVKRLNTKCFKITIHNGPREYHPKLPLGGTTSGFILLMVVKTAKLRMCVYKHPFQATFQKYSHNILDQKHDVKISDIALNMTLPDDFQSLPAYVEFRPHYYNLLRCDPEKYPVTICMARLVAQEGYFLDIKISELQSRYSDNQGCASKGLLISTKERYKVSVRYSHKYNTRNTKGHHIGFPQLMICDLTFVNGQFIISPDRFVTQTNEIYMFYYHYPSQGSQFRIQISVSATKCPGGFIMCPNVKPLRNIKYNIFIRSTDYGPRDDEQNFPLEFQSKTQSDKNTLTERYIRVFYLKVATSINVHGTGEHTDVFVSHDFRLPCFVIQYFEGYFMETPPSCRAHLMLFNNVHVDAKVDIKTVSINTCMRNASQIFNTSKSLSYVDIYPKCDFIFLVGHIPSIEPKQTSLSFEMNANISTINRYIRTNQLWNQRLEIVDSSRPYIIKKLDNTVYLINYFGLYRMIYDKVSLVDVVELALIGHSCVTIRIKIVLKYSNKRSLLEELDWKIDAAIPHLDIELRPGEKAFINSSIFYGSLLFFIQIVYPQTKLNNCSLKIESSIKLPEVSSEVSISSPVEQISDEYVVIWRNLFNSWIETKHVCANMNGTIIGATDQKEQEFINDILEGHPEIHTDSAKALNVPSRFQTDTMLYLGLNNSNERWEDGTTLGYNHISQSTSFLVLKPIKPNRNVHRKFGMTNMCLAYIYRNSPLSSDRVVIPCDEQMPTSVQICKLNKRDTHVRKRKTVFHIDVGSTIPIPIFSACAATQKINCVPSVSKLGLDTSSTLESHLFGVLTDLCSTEPSKIISFCLKQFQKTEISADPLSVQHVAATFKLPKYHCPNVTIAVNNVCITVSKSICLEQTPASFSLYQLLTQSIPIVHESKCQQLKISKHYVLSLSVKKPQPLEEHVTQQLFQCKDKSYVFFVVVLDQVKDCLDGSDEPETQSKRSFKSNTWVCQGDTKGGKMNNETIRLYAQNFYCTNGDCLPWRYMCDGISNCDDNSDEEFCGGFTTPVINLTINSTHVNQNDSVIEGNNFRAQIKSSVQRFKDWGTVLWQQEWSFIITQHYGDFQSRRRTKIDRPLIPCDDDNNEWFPFESVCILHHEHNRRMQHCRNGYHLQHCERINCPRKYKCPGSYCLYTSKVCDGVLDCPRGEDESDCPDEHLSCPDMFRCKNGDCLHTDQICDGTAQCKETFDDEMFCKLQICPDNCVCVDISLQCTNKVNSMNVTAVKHIIFYSNSVVPTLIQPLHLLVINFSANRLNTISSRDFCDMKILVILDLSDNIIKTIDKNSFRYNINIEIIDLTNNLIKEIDPQLFLHTHRIKKLFLRRNKLTKLDLTFVSQFVEGSYIDASRNGIEIIDLHGSITNTSAINHSQAVTISMFGNSISLIINHELPKPILNFEYIDEYFVCLFKKNESVNNTIECYLAISINVHILFFFTGPFVVAANSLGCYKIFVLKTTGSDNSIHSYVAGVIIGCHVTFLSIKDLIFPPGLKSEIHGAKHIVCTLTAVFQSVGLNVFVFLLTLQAYTTTKSISSLVQKDSKTSSLLGVGLIWTLIFLMNIMVLILEFVRSGKLVHISPFCSLYYTYDFLSFDIMVMCMYFLNVACFVIVVACTFSTYKFIKSIETDLHRFGIIAGSQTRQKGYNLLILILFKCGILPFLLFHSLYGIHWTVMSDVLISDMTSSIMLFVVHPLMAFINPVVMLVNLLKRKQN